MTQERKEEMRENEYKNKNEENNQPRENEENSRSKEQAKSVPIKRINQAIIVSNNVF